MRAWRWLGCALLCSCVLPDYEIVESTSAKGRDAGAVASSSRRDGLAAAASPACLECAATSCSEERTSCGGDCANLPWPISPAWMPGEASAAFVKCLTNKCDDKCNVSWGCVDSYRWAPPNKAYNVSIQIGNAFSQAPDIGARITACQASDPGCSAGTGKESSDLTDDNGVVTLTLDPGFFGYFLVEPADPKYYPMTMVWSQPIYRIERSFRINLFERTWLDAMADSLDVTKDDAASGHVIFRAENCLPLQYLGDQDGNAEADGIRVSYSPSGTNSSEVFYTRYALSVDRTLNTTKATGSAYGGALNLPPGSLTLVGSHEQDDVMHVNLRLRPNTLALVHLVPDGR